MTPENELNIRANSHRKSVVFARLGVLLAAKRIAFPDNKAWIDELADLPPPPKG